MMIVPALMNAPGLAVALRQPAARGHGPERHWYIIPNYI